MAEALGLVASGVQIAALAGQIAGVGMKLRALYHEIQDAPEELAFRLQELHLLAGILNRPHPASPDVARICERCLSELSLVLRELESHVKGSKGIRRKLASTKVVLKKKLIQKLENRLCRSVQLLQLATNSHTASTYGLLLQNQDWMMSLLKTHFSPPPQEPEAAMSAATLRPDYVEPRWIEKRESKPCIHNGTSIFPEDSSIWCPFRSIDSTPRGARTFGLPSLTGTVHFETNELNKRHCECVKTTCGGAACPNASCPPNIRASLALPRWLSYAVLEMVAHKSRIGWKQYIRVRNIFPRLDADPNTPFYEACENIAYGQLQSLKSMIDRREVTPWDEDGRGETMWATALYFSQWEICNFLIDLGAEPSSTLPIHRERQRWYVQDIVGFWDIPDFVTTPTTRRDMQAERRKFIERLDDDNGLRFSSLGGFEGEFDEFLSLKRSIWPDGGFYHADFSKQRMQFAISIACAQKVGMLAPLMIRSILGLDIVDSQPVLDFQTCNSLGKTIFHGLASKIAVTTGTHNSTDWHRLTCDVLSYVTDVNDLNQDSNSTFKFILNDIPQRTALMCLISDSIFVEAQVSRHEGHRGPRPPSAVVSGCEISIMAWLKDLYTSGIDLAEYGRNEETLKVCQQTGSKDNIVMLPSVFSHSVGDCELYDKLYLVRSLRLISFQYGKLPVDWKFWWNEPSDEFAGDFWRVVEIENTIAAMSVPGAWID